MAGPLSQDNRDKSREVAAAHADRSHRALLVRLAVAPR